jgi:hypothetical protein
VAALGRRRGTSRTSGAPARCPAGARLRIAWDTGLEDGQFWDAEGVFDKAFVEGGETLMTTVLFLLGPSFPGLVGWRVSFGVNVERRLFGGPAWSWADQAFVPVPWH